MTHPAPLPTACTRFRQWWFEHEVADRMPRGKLSPEACVASDPDAAPGQVVSLIFEDDLGERLVVLRSDGTFAVAGEPEPCGANWVFVADDPERCAGSLSGLAAGEAEQLTAEERVAVAFAYHGGPVRFAIIARDGGDASLTCLDPDALIRPTPAPDPNQFDLFAAPEIAP